MICPPAPCWSLGARRDALSAAAGRDLAACNNLLTLGVETQCLPVGQPPLRQSPPLVGMRIVLTDGARQDRRCRRPCRSRCTRTDGVLIERLVLRLFGYRQRWSWWILAMNLLMLAGLKHAVWRPVFGSALASCICARRGVRARGGVDRALLSGKCGGKRWENGGVCPRRQRRTPGAGGLLLARPPVWRGAAVRRSGWSRDGGRRACPGKACPLRHDGPSRRREPDGARSLSGAAILRRCGGPAPTR